jgi:hypothetical protein
MLHDSTPPLLRGLGTTLILLATILSFFIARQEMKAGDPAGGRVTAAAAAAPAAAQPDDDSVIEEVFSNPWFEALSYLGTGLIGSSFYLEWFLRRRKQPAA